MTTYTPEYTRKVDCPQIQDAWTEPKIGEVFFQEDDGECVITDTDDTAIWYSSYRYTYPKQVIFLPSHGWLIKQLMATGKWASEGEFLILLIRLWHVDDSKTILDLLLHFYMSEKFGLTWTGKEWK